MKLILRKSVDQLGDVGDVVNVKTGYARNYLLPRGIAARASKGVMQEIEAAMRREAEVVKERDQELRAMVDQLNDASVTIQAKVNEDGRLFGSIGPKEIAEALQADGFTRVTPEMIRLEDHFKEPGVFEAPVHVTADAEAVCKVWVVPEE